MCSDFRCLACLVCEQFGLRLRSQTKPTSIDDLLVTDRWTFYVTVPRIVMGLGISRPRKMRIT